MSSRDREEGRQPDPHRRLRLWSGVCLWRQRTDTSISTKPAAPKGNGSFSAGFFEAGVGLFSQVTSDSARGSGLKLCQGRFRLDSRKKLFTGRVVRYWNRLPRAMVELQFLEICKRFIDVALWGMV